MDGSFAGGARIGYLVIIGVLREGRANEEVWLAVWREGSGYEVTWMEGLLEDMKRFGW